MSHYIIRRMRLAHCKRGPSVCEKCREMDVEKICLLDISPPHMGEIQRRVIEVELEGETVWREFDIVRTFETEEEAREYAEQATSRRFRARRQLARVRTCGRFTIVGRPVACRDARVPIS